MDGSVLIWLLVNGWNQTSKFRVLTVRRSLLAKIISEAQDRDSIRVNDDVQSACVL